jgi:hypothetical protein
MAQATWIDVWTDIGILAVGAVVGAAIAGREVQFGQAPKWECQDVDDAWVYVQTHRWPAFGGTDSQVSIVMDLESGRWSYNQLKARCVNSET